MSDHLLSLDGAPWRRLVLSDRRDVWCLVDATDLPWILEHNWNFGWHRNTPWKYYAKRNIGAARSTVYLHREIMIRAEPGVALDAVHCDHINGQSLDNRRANLRWLTPPQNRAHITRRENIPSLDAIAASLIAGDAAAALLQEVPF